MAIPFKLRCWSPRSLTFKYQCPCLVMPEVCEVLLTINDRPLTWIDGHPWYACMSNVICLQLRMELFPSRGHAAMALDSLIPSRYRPHLDQLYNVPLHPEKRHSSAAVPVRNSPLRNSWKLGQGILEGIPETGFDLGDDVIGDANWQRAEHGRTSIQQIEWKIKRAGKGHPPGVKFHFR
jgi:hypothetical protein